MERIAHTDRLDICFETFGQKNSPVILLIMGSCSQGILWPTEFCEKLSSRGFFVIRYDHRDAGLSTCFDFDREPYDLLDMAKDAIGLLDYLGVQKAHLVGLSTGAPIAELMSIHFPEKVESLALMATSSDFRPQNRALSGLPPEEGSLSSPSPRFLRAMEEFTSLAPISLEDKIQQRMAIWNLLNGDAHPLDPKWNYALQKQFLERVRSPQGIINHLLANNLSEELVRTAAAQVKVPTLIFQGTEDPIYKTDHGESLNAKIKNSKYYLVEGMGHIPNPYFSDYLIEVLSSSLCPMSVR